MSEKKAQKKQPLKTRGETNQHILEAAMSLFSKQGYSRTTTRALAQAAGITEMTLFRYFESKEKLFEAVVEQFGGQVVAGEMEAQLNGNYREDLLRLGSMIMKILRQRGDAMRMMLCESSHFPAMAAALAQNPRMLRQMLARYLKRQIDAGQVRPLDVEAAAHIFWGIFFTYSLGADLFAEPDIGEASDDAVVTHFVDIFINGTMAR
jgi:AcrR family transcriptional regulator